MKSFRQLLRQPIKLIAGLILMTVAACIVCVCVGQALAAKNTAQQLERQFTTVALPTKEGLERIRTGGFRVPKMDTELGAWLEETAEARPDVIKTLAQHGFLSAYIPALTPLNYTQGDYVADEFQADRIYWYNQPEPAGQPYSCAMLVITLEEVIGPVEEIKSTNKDIDFPIQAFPSADHYINWQSLYEPATVPVGYRINLTGTVTEVISLQEGYRDPTGMTARLTMTAVTQEELEALNLQPGESYLVYGMDYYDEDWALRGYLADDRRKIPLKIDAFDLSKLVNLTEEQSQSYLNRNGYFAHNLPVAKYDGKVLLSQAQVNQINSVSMTLETPVPLLDYDVIRDAMLRFQEFRLKTDITYTDMNGKTVTMTAQEYTERYQIPTITQLEGSVEEFLQSAEGVPWRQALEQNAVNNHAFAVIGIEKAMYLGNFAMQEASITQGRDFTDEEVAGSERVCILSEALAAANGLEVGDSITLNLYQGDPGLPYQAFRAEDAGILNPAADFYFDTTPILETAEYTIVGLWRSPDTWVDVSLNEYGFSPNTVFVPKTSVETAMEYPEGVLFSTTVLQNGKIEEFLTLAAETDFSEPFICYDQGYAMLSHNFYNYEALSRQVLTVGAAVYTVILLLFLLLFPGTQGKTAATMRSLGVSRGKRIRHVLQGAAGVAVPATVLGGGLGLMLWQRVLDSLQASAETAIALQLERSMLFWLALIQLIAALILSGIVALWVTAPKDLSRRRKK